MYDLYGTGERQQAQGIQEQAGCVPKALQEAQARRLFSRGAIHCAAA